KISHAMNAMGGTHALAIPNESRFIRFGIRVEGAGSAELSSLLLGESVEEPASIIGRSPYLVLTKQYPSYDDLYKYGFLHSRVRAYREHGLNVEVFRITSKVDQRYREFEGVDVASGDADLLDKTLASGKYKHVLVHLLDEVMWRVLEKHLVDIQVTVWVHGAEAQSWKRRDFEFALMPDKEVERQKRLSDQRTEFWKRVVSTQHPNLKLVFVSNYLLETFQEDIGVHLDATRYSIIHNFIDPRIFRYNEKTLEDRHKILSIRPYAKRVYANDLTVKAIELLAKEAFFCELSFTIVGDGELFEQTVFPLRQYDNVTIEKRFLTHAEIAEYHKQHGVLLVPTRMDTQGVSRDEALSSGLVAVTTNVAAVPEFVDSECAVLTEPESPEALAKAIKELHMNPDSFLKLSKNGSKRVADQCGFDVTIGKEIELIQ
ncbi:MAG TPA: glycosyltransferase, partial [Campylobacterales bacterium]|nr:glycosyltransferase [Campylobacterales bacterium]